MNLEKNNLVELELKFQISEFPLNVAVEPHNFCNLNCIMCANDKLKRERGHMDIELYKKIIDEIAEVNPNTRLWIDFYGEPLLAKYKLYYFIDYAKHKGLTNICMNTNGTLLSEEMIEMLLDSGIDFISVDIDAFSAEVYETIRVGAKRDEVYNNVLNLVDRREKRGNENSRLIIEVKTIEMDENRHEIKEIINFWKDKKVKINVRKCYSWAGNIENGCNTSCEERIACGNAIGQCVIAWDGRVVACGVDCEAEYVCGDVNNQSIQEIWKNKNEKFNRLHMEHKFDELPDVCKKCSDWSLLGGDIRIDENGKSYKKNYNSGQLMID